MQSLSLVKGKESLAQALDEALALEPTVLYLFIAPALFQDEAALALLKARTQGRAAIGCSTAGEIAGVSSCSDSLALLAVRFDETRARVAAHPLDGAGDSFAAGAALGEKLKATDLRAVFVLAAGKGVNGSALTEGLASSLGRSVVISGGLAGDNVRFGETFALCSGEIGNNLIVAAGLYGEHVVVSCGSEGGWRPFGPARRVTKAEGNVLYELDGKPALQLYKQYLGDKARQLPASGLAYPFAILRGDKTTSGLIRSALDIDSGQEALIMAGDVPQGAQVCLMHADTGALIQGAAQAAAEALRTHAGPEEGGCALVVNCVGRKMVLGMDAEEELEAVSDSFLPSTPMAGFYSYGEICSYIGTGRTELHNQTMTITYITERKDV